MSKNRRFNKQTDENRGSLSLFIPNYGWIDRSFPNKGRAIDYLNHNYGQEWRSMRVRFQNTPVLTEKVENYN